MLIFSFSYVIFFVEFYIFKFHISPPIFYQLHIVLFPFVIVIPVSFPLYLCYPFDYRCQSPIHIFNAILDIPQSLQSLPKFYLKFGDVIYNLIWTHTQAHTYICIYKVGERVWKETEFECVWVYVDGKWIWMCVLGMSVCVYGQKVSLNLCIR